MEYNCPNCNHIISENFCAHCGQKKYKRIDKKYITDELQYTILHTNKGFLYSVKNIIKNPGKTAKEFIEGNRVNHYKPILLAFVLSGISAFISLKIIGLMNIMREYYAGSNMNSEFMNDVMAVQSSYNSVIMLLMLPVFAFFTKLGFKKWGNNYYEHIVMNAYILSFYTLLNIMIIYPVMYLFKSDTNLVIIMSSASMLFIPLILVWFYKNFYEDKPLKNIIGRVLLTIGLMLMGYLSLIIVGAIVGVIIAIMKGPEALEYLKPQ